MIPEIPTNLTGHMAISLVLVVIFVLLFFAGVFFIVLVTYLGQWDMYYPKLDKWLKARKALSLERARKKKNIQRKREKKHGGPDGS
jgi:hypothetical protein